MRLRPVLFVLFFLVAAAGLAVGVYALRGHMYAHEALPGVRVLGADVSGSGQAEAAAKIDRAAAPRLAAPVTVVAAGHELTVVPGELVRVDSTATAAAALEAGRGSTTSRALALLSPLPASRNVAPVLILRRVAAGALFAKLDGYGKPSASATVTLAGLAPVVHPARAGTRVDQQAFVDALERHVATGHSTIVVRYRRADPTVSTEAATIAATRARTVLSAPVQLRYAGIDLGSLGPERLATLLRFRPHGKALDATFDPKTVAAVVGPLVRRWRRPAIDARLATDGNRVRLLPEREGANLDAAATVSALAAATYGRLGRVADVTLAPVQPKVTTESLRKLGITRKLVSFTTDMGSSSSNRIHNVHLMADFIDGTIIKPGALFSFNKVVGPRTAQRGFLEGQEIIGSLVLPVDRRRRLPDRDHALQRRLRDRTADPRADEPQPVPEPLSARARRDGLVGRPRSRLPQRPEARDPDHDLLHRPDADLHVLGDAAGAPHRRRDRAEGRLQVADDELRRRPVRAGRIGEGRLGLGRRGLLGHCPAHGLRARQGAAPRLVPVDLHPGRLDDGLRPGRPPAGPVLRGAEGLARPRARARSGARSRRARSRPPPPGRSSARGA